jgi:hypothetical protein
MARRDEEREHHVEDYLKSVGDTPAQVSRISASKKSSASRLPKQLQIEGQLLCPMHKLKLDFRS